MKEKVVAALELTRPTNAGVGALGAAVGGYVGGSLGVPVAVAAVVTAFGTGAGNAVNDYYDADIDAVNRPDRPVPSGRISRRGAAFVSAALFAAALVLTVALLPLLAVGIGVVNLVVLVVYSSHLKRMPLVGNVAVAYLAGSAFLFGGAAAEGVRYTVVLFFLAGLVNLGREIVKDVEDVEGDAAEGARTLPVVYGERRAVLLATASVLVAVGLSPAPYFVFDGFGTAYLVAVATADVVLLEGVRRSWKSPSSGQKLLKTAMFVALVAFIAGRAV
ncbi:geranylgeranylglycerol-phosphate geranylgeranyltransferase [Haladaptatus sp. F3-133]|uniref:Digeranylgeranylglyceryl phosphate synthase n=1 Tax=Halorutilus salinus TaxID=2487751 RepID=A0A9Q4C2N0_9EURY|nr:geranylgeranylglycerol-phosphate geranylgeranyltransferase [Halorutilus salinus]